MFKVPPIMLYIVPIKSSVPPRTISSVPPDTPKNVGKENPVMVNPLSPPTIETLRAFPLIPTPKSVTPRSESDPYALSPANRPLNVMPTGAVVRESAPPWTFTAWVLLITTSGRDAIAIGANVTPIPVIPDKPLPTAKPILAPLMEVTSPNPPQAPPPPPLIVT